MKILECFKALADETRLRILNLARRREMSVGEIVEALDMGQSRVSRHLKILNVAGLLTSRRDGLWMLYRVSEIGPGRDVLDSLERLLDQEPHRQADWAAAEHGVQKSRMRTRGFFDSVASHWDQLKADIIGETDLAGAIVEHVRPCACAADLGCGTGDLLDHLLRRSARVVGVDSSPQMLGRAQERFAGAGDAVDLRIGELEHLPLRDNEADCAVLNLVLHHLADPLTGMREASRIVSRGSVLVIADFEKHEQERMRTRYGDRWLGFSNADMRGWAVSAGLRIESRSSIRVNNDLIIAVYAARKQ